MKKRTLTLRKETLRLATGALPAHCKGDNWQQSCLWASCVCSIAWCDSEIYTSCVSQCIKPNPNVAI